MAGLDFTGNKRIGATLLEMSITILVFGIMIVGIIEFQMSITAKSHVVKTINRMEVLESAINQYIMENQQLPCPAPLKMRTNDLGNGIESRSGSYCLSNPTTGIFENSDGIFYGMIPAKTLGLSSEYMLDAWLSKIIYVMDGKYAGKLGFMNSGGESITIKDSSGEIVTDRAIYLMISTGKNTNGSFRENFQRNINENYSDKINVATDDSFSKIFMKETLDVGFDDMVMYRSKDEIIREIDWSDMPCSFAELKSLDSNWDHTEALCGVDGVCEYGQEIPSKNACVSPNIASKSPIEFEGSYNPVRKCLAFGKWSFILYPCEEGCDVSNLNTVITAYGTSKSVSMNLSDIADDSNTKNFKRVARGEYATFECAYNGKIGFLTMQCQMDGTWRAVSGLCKNRTERVTN